MATRRSRKNHDREALREQFRQFAETRDAALREELILAYGSLAAYLARKFANRGEPLDDLTQVANIGLLKAVDRFDPSRGIEFTTYATVTIVGEIKRHFRDKFWTVRVPRRLRELNNALMKSVEGLAQRLGRSPTLQEIADESGVPFEEVVEAFELGRAYNPASLDAELAEGDEDRGTSLMDYLGGEDPELAAWKTGTRWKRRCAACRSGSRRFCGCATTKDARRRRSPATSASPRCMCRASSATRSAA